MSLLPDSRTKLLFWAFLLSLLALVGTSALGLLAALSALGGASSGTPLLFVLLDAAAPYVVASLLVGLLSFFLLVGLVVAGIRQASLPRDERLATVGRKVERVVPEARRVGLAERFEPTTEDRIRELKERYVEGELTEWEYERRLQDLLADGDASDERVRRELGRTEREFER